MKERRILNEHLQNNEDQFQTSKNEFLTTIFELPQQNRQIKSQSLLQTNIITATQILKSNLTISKQYLVFYDPSLNNKEVKNIHKKLTDSKINKFTSKYKNSNRSLHVNQKPFVQTYQPKNQQHSIEFKLYNEEQRKKVNIPGPGAYNISKSFAQPVYETIVKNDNTFLVKLNNIEGTANFKSKNKKLNAIYEKQKIQNPGPGYYLIDTEQIRKKRNQKNKSKLEEYAKNYESNYKFIFEVFNSQYQTIESIPNYKITSPPNGTPYNGKPQRLQNLTDKKDINNELNPQEFKKNLLGNVKSSLSNNQYQRERSVTKLIQKERVNQNQNPSIFPIKTVDQQKLKQNKMKINSQFSERIVQNSDSYNFQQRNNESLNLKQKIKLLFQPRLNHNNQQKMNKKQHIYQRAGYFDGSQKQKLFTKYNVKTQNKNKTFKKLLQPLPQRQKRFQSLDTNTTDNMNTYLEQKQIHHRYDINMINFFLSKNINKHPNQSNSRHSSVTFHTKDQKIKKPSNSTIQYH